MYGPVETAINLTTTIIDVIFVTDNIVKNSLPIVEIDHLSHHFNFHYNHLIALHCATAVAQCHHHNRYQNLTVV